MDDWQIPSQPTHSPTPSQQQQQRMSMNTIGPMHSYHSMRTRPSPYPMNEVKQPYSYQQTSMPMKTNSNSNVYTPLSYPPTHMEQIPHQQRLITAKSTSGPIATYNAGQQQMHAARARSMPYPSPTMYTHSPASVYQCNNPPHMNYPNQSPLPPSQQPQQQQQQMYYQNYYPQTHPMSYQANSNSNKHELMKNKIKPNANDFFSSPSTSYHPSVCSNSYVSAQQLPPQPSLLSSSSSSMSQEYQTFSNQSQIFPSPPSNPSTPYQGEFNANADFGVPYHQGQPSSVNSLTDALCPSGDTADRQLTPGPPSVGTPRVAHPQYSFPQTPSTPTTSSRLPNEQNIDELTAFLQDPVNLYLTDDITSTLFDDIEVLADTYLGGRSNNDHQSNNDSSLDYDIILNYLCSDDLISTVCQK